MASMNNTDAISLNVYEQYTQTGESEQASRHLNSDRIRAFALVGSALSQLPIWGASINPVHALVS